MNKHLKLLMILVLFASLITPYSVSAKELAEDKVIFGGSYTLESGETLNGDIVVFGGSATIEEDATVNGDVAIFGGRLKTNGTVNGDLVALGGFADVESRAVVNGDLTLLGSNIDLAEEATITGSVVTSADFPLELSFPSLVQLSAGSFPDLRTWRNPLVSLIWYFFKLMVWSGLAMLATLFFKTQEERIGKAAIEQPVLSSVVGFLVMVLLPVVLLALLITILLSPLSLLGVFLAFMAWAAGWIALGLKVGTRLTKSLEGRMEPALAAGLGTLVVMGIFNGFRAIVPCLGFVPKLLVGMWMLGAVTLTQFGTQDYAPGSGPTTVQQEGQYESSAGPATADPEKESSS